MSSLDSDVRGSALGISVTCFWQPRHRALSLPSPAAVAATTAFHLRGEVLKGIGHLAQLFGRDHLGIIKDN